MSLNKELKRENKNINSHAFYQVALDHFPFIRKNNLYAIKGIEGVTAEIYRGDFHGLLNHLGEIPDFNRIQTAFNNLRSPLDFSGQETSIRLISKEYLTKLFAIHKVQM